MKLWQKKSHNNQSQNAKLTESFTVGNDYLLDQYLIPYDVAASKVHARSLGKAGILTEKEVGDLCDGLDNIVRLWESDRFEILPEHEDGHTAIEQWLTEHVGEAGGKIHTGRSRNDQVLTAMRLYERDSLREVESAVERVIQRLQEFGDTHKGVPLPGYTHTRKAMLSGVTQWAMGFAELLSMQLEMSPAIMKLTGRSPLGTAAGFGSTIDLDREAQVNELDFDSAMISATTAQLSRGWVEWQVVNYLAGISFITARLSADIIRYSGEHYRYFDLDISVCTGSSIMPQKKNPDVAELIRGKHGVISGYANTLHHIIQNLESGYHRDLQLTKEPVILAFQTILQILQATELLIDGCSVNISHIEQACTTELLAAEAANLIVLENGIPFREAYKLVAENPDLYKNLRIRDFMQRYTQLGSPGNIGKVR